MDSARSQAMQVVERALTDSVELMVALQYLGMLAPDALAPLKEISSAAPIVERMAEVPAVPIGRQEIMAQQQARREQLQERRAEIAANPVYHEWARPIHPETYGRSSLFADWVDGRVQWTPAVMGWSDDDPRAEGWQDGRYD